MVIDFMDLVRHEAYRELAFNCLKKGKKVIVWISDARTVEVEGEESMISLSVEGELTEKEKAYVEILLCIL